MDIRKYKDSDKKGLEDLLKSVFPDSADHNEPSKVIAAKLNVDDLIWVAETEGEILGCCMGGYDGVRGWLYGVSVLNQYRRRGIGARLVQEVVGQLKTLGCVKVNLQVRADNADVVNFYKTLGFKLEERLSMGAFI